MNGLEFNAEQHSYAYEGARVVSVTQALKPLVSFSGISEAVLEAARQKGVAIHKMVELCAKDDLDEDALPAWMLPALATWRKFQADSGFEIISSEKRVFHPLYRYAGTMDLYGFMRHSGNFAYIDIKRSLMAGAAIGMQIAAYQTADAAEPGQDKATARQKHQALRYALRLSERAPARLEQYEKHSDFYDFLTCLNFQRLKEKLA